MRFLIYCLLCQKKIVEKLVAEWDPDFVRLTPAKKRELEKIEKENDYRTFDDCDK